MRGRGEESGAEGKRDWGGKRLGNVEESRGASGSGKDGMTWSIG